MTMNRLIGCTCSEMQLGRVGCDCAADREPIMIVEIWPRGYAHDDGLKRVHMSAIVDYASEARKLFGMSATVYGVRELRKAALSVSAETARYYTQGDNT
jgi:hypothetical protein